MLITIVDDRGHQIVDQSMSECWYELCSGQLYPTDDPLVQRRYRFIDDDARETYFAKRV